MNNEFKKSKSNNETRYTLESMTAGATGSGSIATSAGSVGKVQKRGNILAQEAGKDKVDASKPRNFVAKNAKMGGAGAHKDKKKEQKQGAEKHKKPYMEALKQKIEDLKSKLNEAQGVAEGSYDLRSAVLSVLQDIYNGAQEGEDMIDTVADELGDYFQDVKRSKDKTLRQAYQFMRQQGGDAEGNPEMMAQVAKQAIDMLSQQGVAEGSEFGAYYYEKVAQEIFNNRKDISSEDEVLNQAWKIVSAERGNKSARYMFNYDEDFPSDLVSAYFYLQKQKQDVAEGASDFIGDSIEALRSSVPGLKQQDFLDELYMYIENQYGQRAAEMMANAGQDDFDEWYDSYLDNPEQGMAEGSGANKTHLAMAYLKAVVMAPMGTPEKRRILNWQQILSNQFDIEMDTATLAQMLPQLDSQMKSGNLDKLQNRMASRGELEIGETTESDTYMESLAESLQQVLSEKAVSKKQQKFMGMVHAAQKGEKPASKEVAKVAKDMGKKDAKDFAATKHKGLPEKKKSKK